MFVISLWNVQEDHVMLAIIDPGKSRAKSTLFLSVVLWINLCGGSWVVLSGREQMRMIGVGISFASQNKAADTHANWLMDNGDSGPGAQWMAPDLHD